MSPDRPSPQPDHASAPFFAGLDRGQLLVQRCPACNTVQLGELYCNHCHGDGLVWEAASGQGKVFSFVAVHMRYHDAFADHLPYNAVTVELDEGPRLYSNLIDTPLSTVYIGQHVKVSYSRLSTGTRVPVFTPVEEPMQR